MFMLLKFSWFFIHIKLRTNQYFENLFFCVIFSLILKVFNYISIADFKIRVLKQMLENVDLHVFIFHFDICFTFDPSNPIPFQCFKDLFKFSFLHYYRYFTFESAVPRILLQLYQTATSFCSESKILPDVIKLPFLSLIFNLFFHRIKHNFRISRFDF